MTKTIQRWIAPVLALAVCFALSTQPLAAQDAQRRIRKLKINILEGDGQVNLVRQRVASEPVVEVVDENNRPVAGAIVTFTLPTRGAGGSFLNGAKSVSLQTDAAGRAGTTGLQANQVEGAYKIRINASHQGRTARTTITQANSASGAAAAGAGVTVGGGIATKTLVTILVVAGAAAGGTAVALTQGGSSTGTPTSPRAGVSLGGSGTVGAPGTP